MHIQAGNQQRLTLWGDGCRAMVGLNPYKVTQPGVIGMDLAEAGFTRKVTAWPNDGYNTLIIVLIGVT